MFLSEVTGPNTGDNRLVVYPVVGRFFQSVFVASSRCNKNWKHIQGEGVAAPEPYWTWEAENCHLEEVTESKLCHVMEGRKGLLVVGKWPSAGCGVELGRSGVPLEGNAQR